MGAKPDSLCNLERKKLIDVQKDFVATFNWLKDFCNNLKGDADEKGKDAGGNQPRGIKVDASVSDHPVIRLTGGGASEVTFVGTDGTTYATCKTGRVTFASADDSNVVVTPTADEAGNVTITIGVYYK